MKCTKKRKRLGTINYLEETSAITLDSPSNYNNN